VAHFGLSDISPADHLTVEAYVDGSMVKAVKVERSDPNVTSAHLEGAVDAASNPGITVVGVVIDTTGFTFPDGSSAFWAGATPGAVVRVSGTSSGSMVTWNTIALEH
jgi:hypothetical protein